MPASEAAHPCRTKTMLGSRELKRGSFCLGSFSASDILFFKIKDVLGRVWVYTEMGVEGEVERGYVSQAYHSV